MAINSHQRINRKRTVFIIIVMLIVSLFYLLSTTGYRDILENSALLKSNIYELGSLGPLIIILSMMIAIIMSPIPSAPIALAAGALYGHTWGTLYVLIGSSLGAIIAFSIARLLGYDILQRWFGGKLAVNWPGSQNTLMGIVFFSRLLPFVSFDIVSYIAGLTALSFWRFCIATIVGIAPASFLLAHFGGELSSVDTQRVALAVLVLGLITLVPLFYRFIRSRPSN